MINLELVYRGKLPLNKEVSVLNAAMILGQLSIRTSLFYSENAHAWGSYWKTIVTE